MISAFAIWVFVATIHFSTQMTEKYSNLLHPKRILIIFTALEKNMQPLHLHFNKTKKSAFPGAHQGALAFCIYTVYTVYYTGWLKECYYYGLTWLDWTNRQPEPTYLDKKYFWRRRKKVKTNVVHLYCSAVFWKTKGDLKWKCDFLQEKIYTNGTRDKTTIHNSWSHVEVQVWGMTNNRSPFGRIW